MRSNLRFGLGLALSLSAGTLFSQGLPFRPVPRDPISEPAVTLGRARVRSAPSMDGTIARAQMAEPIMPGPAVAPPTAGPWTYRGVPIAPGAPMGESMHAIQGPCDNCCGGTGGALWDGGLLDGFCRPMAADPHNVWISAEYLLWRLNQPTTPPLLTTAPTGTAINVAGNLNAAGSSVLFGGSDGSSSTSGVRLTLGGWFQPDRTIGLEFSGFMLSESSIRYSAASDAGGNPILARPRVNAITGNEGATFISFPGQFAGAIDISQESKLSGAELNLLGRSSSCSPWKFYAGLRYLSLDDSLNISQATTVLPNGVAFFNGNLVANPNGLALSDQFATSNQFWGGQIGIGRTFTRGGPFSLDLTGKLALGRTSQSYRIRGSTALLTPGGVAATAQGGLLALSSNIGDYSNDECSVVSEFKAQINYQLTPHLAVFAGYNFLYWSNVTRAAGNIDRTVNTTLVPSAGAFNPAAGGPARPAVLINQSDLVAHGANFGLLYRY